MADLRFLSLHLEDFKNFSEAEIKLDRAPGLYFISGQNKINPELGANGVGKSTIWDAMFWCLFGKTIRDARPAASVSPWGKKGMTRVHLKFMRGDDEIELVRTRNPNYLELYEDEGPREISQDEIPKILGMNEEMLRRTIILGQFGTMFLDLRPEQQSQMFTEALSLDVWLKAVDQAKVATTNAEAQIREIEKDQAASAALLDSLRDDISNTIKASDEFDEAKKDNVENLTISLYIAEEADKAANANVTTKPNPPDDTSKATSRKLNDLLQQEAGLLRDHNNTKRDVRDETDEVERLIALGKKPKKTCKECGQEIKDAEYTRQLMKAQTALTEANDDLCRQVSELETLSKGIATLKTLLAREEEAVKAARKAYDRALDEWTEVNREVNRTSMTLQRAKDDLKREKATVNHHRELLINQRARRDKVKDQQAVMIKALDEQKGLQEQAKYWVDGFRELRLSIIDETLVELEMSASRHASMLGLEDWGIRFETERETASGKVSAGFTVMLYPPGQDEPIRFESYSGGESQRWQLATSFALSEVLLARAGVSPSIEVLDEPTRGLSAVGVDDLLEHLHDRALELGRAIFFVDHHSLDKGSFDGTMLITKSKSGSELAWV